MEGGTRADGVGLDNGNRTLTAEREPTSLMARVAVAAFCRVASLIYRVSVSWIPSGIFEDGFVLAFSALLLGLALLAQREDTLRKYWAIPLAFFVFTLAGFFGDGSISPLQHWFVKDVLRETTSSNNPLASSVLGTVWAQLFGTLLLTVPIVLLTKGSGSDLRSIFINRPANWWGLAITVA